MAAVHVHTWRMAIHMDGCHHYGTTYQCDCGAARAVGAERNFRRDPYAAIWALPSCDRCTALLAGARRRPAYDRTLEKGAERWVRTVTR